MAAGYVYVLLNTPTHFYKTTKQLNIIIALHIKQ